MNLNDYFKIAHLIVKLKQEDFSPEIFYRTAINRLYYGIFHLVQVNFGIIISQTEIKRCHAYVKEQIEESNIRGDYSELEAYRVEADYNISKPISINHYKDALRIQKRILDKISEHKYVPYEDDEEFFFRHRK